MTELEQRLTNEFGKLAEQVQQLADQHASDLKGYIKWSKTLGEQVTHLGGVGA